MIVFIWLYGFTRITREELDVGARTGAWKSITRRWSAGGSGRA
jgi:hypothetical protein